MNKSLFFFLLLSSCFISACKGEVKTKEDKFEKEVTECIFSSYRVIGVDLESELYKFENYLIQSHILKDTSGDSYYAFFEEMRISDSIVKFPGIYKIDSLVIGNKHLLRECFEKFDNNMSENYLNSRLKKYRFTLGLNMLVEHKGISAFAEAILYSLDETLFELKPYKINVLLSLYYLEGGAVEQRSFDAIPKIEIVIDADESVFINGKETQLDQFSTLFHEEFNKLSNFEREICIARLSVNKNVKMGIVSQVKNFLREKNKTQRIHYRTLY